MSPDSDLICLGEMGIGNTTAAAALAAASFGGGGARWAGRGTGVDDDGLARKRDVIDRALDRHSGLLDDPLRIAAAFGGRELAAILGATLAARRHSIPVLLDGFVCTAAVAPLYRLRTDTLAHAIAGHVSAEAGHRMLLDELKLKPLLDLDMRLGEASGAATALLILRAALACHTGMATFAEAGVSDKPADEGRRAEGGGVAIRHCARSEAIQGRLRKNLDCFVANAPRNDEAFILSREAGRVTARSAVEGLGVICGAAA